MPADKPIEGVMNRRSRVRFMSDISVVVTRLTDSTPSLKGRLANLSAHGLSIILNCELPIGILLKIEWGNTEFVGELIHCQPYGSEFMLGVNVENPVYDTKKSVPSRESAT
jgi:hypothetical protein